eukprot:XP_016858561.1 uncharacterized protein LOC107985115 [Homo sapiens]
MGFDGGQQQKTTLFPNRNHWLQCSGLLWSFLGDSDKETVNALRDQPFGEALGKDRQCLPLPHLHEVVQRGRVLTSNSSQGGKGDSGLTPISQKDNNNIHRNPYGGRGGVGLDALQRSPPPDRFQGGSGIWSPGWAPPALLGGPLRRPSHTCSAQDYSGPPPRAPAPTRAATRIVSNQTAARGALTAAARPCWRAAQAWPPREPAGRRGKERPEPSGSLPWDTSCSALGLGRSPHLSGSLPRPPAEVCAGGDIRHPRPAPLRARLGLAAGPGALWVSHVAAPGLPRGPAGPEGRPGALFSAVLLLWRPQDTRPVDARNGRPGVAAGDGSWNWGCGMERREEAPRAVGRLISDSPATPPPPPAEARAAQPLLPLRDAEGWVSAEQV